MTKYFLSVGVISLSVLATFSLGLYYAIEYPKQSVLLTVNGIITQNNCQIKCHVGPGPCSQSGTVQINYIYQNVSYSDKVTINNGQNKLSCNPDCCETLFEKSMPVWLLLDLPNPGKILIFSRDSSYNPSDYDSAAVLFIILSIILSLPLIISFIFWKRSSASKFSSMKEKEMEII